MTREEVQEQRRRFAALNARPIKKVAEAEARKKIRVNCNMCVCISTPDGECTDDLMYPVS